MSNNIAYYRTKKHLSQQQLADIVGCKRSTLSMYELGTINPSINVAMRIAAALRVSMPKLFPLEAVGPTPDGSTEEAC